MRYHLQQGVFPANNLKMKKRIEVYLRWADNYRGATIWFGLSFWGLYIVNQEKNLYRSEIRVSTKMKRKSIGILS